MAARATVVILPVTLRRNPGPGSTRKRSTSELLRSPGESALKRFVTPGLSGFGRLLVVVYTHREPDIIRLISAWKANQRQRVQHEKSRR